MPLIESITFVQGPNVCRVTDRAPAHGTGAMVERRNTPPLARANDVPAQRIWCAGCVVRVGVSGRGHRAPPVVVPAVKNAAAARDGRRRAWMWRRAVAGRRLPAARAARRAPSAWTGVSCRVSLHGLHAPSRFAGASARSGRMDTGTMWSAVVERTVQVPGKRNQQIGCSRTTARAWFRHRRLERHARISAGVALIVRATGTIAAARDRDRWWSSHAEDPADRAELDRGRRVGGAWRCR